MVNTTGVVLSLHIMHLWSTRSCLQLQGSVVLGHCWTGMPHVWNRQGIAAATQHAVMHMVLTPAVPVPLACCRAVGGFSVTFKSVDPWQDRVVNSRMLMIVLSLIVGLAGLLVSCCVCCACVNRRFRAQVGYPRLLVICFCISG